MADAQRVLAMMALGGLQGWLGGRGDRQRLKQSREEQDWQRELFGLQRDIAKQNLQQEMDASFKSGDERSVLEQLRDIFPAAEEADIKATIARLKGQEQLSKTGKAAQDLRRSTAEAGTSEAEEMNAPEYFGSRADNETAKVSATQASEDLRRTGADRNRAQTADIEQSTADKKAKKMDNLLAFLANPAFSEAAMDLDPGAAGAYDGAIRRLQIQNMQEGTVDPERLDALVATLFSPMYEGMPSIHEVALRKAKSKSEIAAIQSAASLLGDIVDNSIERVESRADAQGQLPEDQKVILDGLNAWATEQWNELGARFEKAEPTAAAANARVEEAAENKSQAAFDAKIQELINKQLSEAEGGVVGGAFPLDMILGGRAATGVGNLALGTKLGQKAVGKVGGMLPSWLGGAPARAETGFLGGMFKSGGQGAAPAAATAAKPKPSGPFLLEDLRPGTMEGTPIPGLIPSRGSIPMGGEIGNKFPVPVPMGAPRTVTPPMGNMITGPPNVSLAQQAETFKNAGAGRLTADDIMKYLTQQQPAPNMSNQLGYSDLIRYLTGGR